MRHKHYNEIVAWAEGKPVQTRDFRGVWRDVTVPLWESNYEYRIKPEPVQYRLFECRTTVKGANTVLVAKKSEVSDQTEFIESQARFVRWIGPWQTDKDES